MRRVSVSENTEVFLPGDVLGKFVSYIDSLNRRGAWVSKYKSEMGVIRALEKAPTRRYIGKSRLGIFSYYLLGRIIVEVEGDRIFSMLLSPLVFRGSHAHERYFEEFGYGSMYPELALAVYCGYKIESRRDPDAYKICTLSPPRVWVVSQQHILITVYNPKTDNRIKDNDGLPISKNGQVK